jgi:hypothetical protein
MPNEGSHGNQRNMGPTLDTGTPDIERPHSRGGNKTSSPSTVQQKSLSRQTLKLGEACQDLGLVFCGKTAARLTPIGSLRCSTST